MGGEGRVTEWVVRGGSLSGCGWWVWLGWVLIYIGTPKCGPPEMRTPCLTPCLSGHSP